MEAAWFAIVSIMLAVYAVLDGFDFGVGILHRFVARTDDERRTVLAAIGPIWDGNEVWLIAAGGVFVFAFPRAYSAAFSGLYLALMIVLWLLVLRGISIEFRSKVDHPLWRSGWDTVFASSSAAMAMSSCRLYGQSAIRAADTSAVQRTVRSRNRDGRSRTVCGDQPAMIANRAAK